MYLKFRILDSIFNPQDALIANEIFHRFLTLKGCSATFVFLVNLVDIFLNQRSMFVSSTCWIFIFSPIGFFASSTETDSWVSPRKFFENFTFSPVSQVVPHRGTETGCMIYVEDLASSRFFYNNLNLRDQINF